METTKNEFKFTGIGIYNTNGVNTLDIGTIIKSVYLNGVFVEYNSRLGCQIRIEPELNGLEVRLAEVGE